LNTKIIIAAAIAVLSSIGMAQAGAIKPAYTPPPLWDAMPKNPGAGQADMYICSKWLMDNAARLNEPKGPGGRNSVGRPTGEPDPIIAVYGPTATRGSFGSQDVACYLTFRYQSGKIELGWLTLEPALAWNWDN
jgi:hypothetical protein